jgi:SAM-dependent methyltransferase
MAPFRMSSSRRYLERWVQDAAASVPSGSVVLDAGAGESPYARWFSGHHYESADFAQVDKAYSTNLTYTCDLAELPVDGSRFDLIVMTQVLEHLPEPGRVLAEMRRVLKPRAELWFSTPLFYEEHEQPYDYYRYTQFGLRHLCQSAGLEVVSIDWLEGYFGTLGYQLNMAANQFPTNPEIYGGGPKGYLAGAIGKAGRRAAGRIARTLDRLDDRYKVTNVGMPKNYVVRASRGDG